MDEPKVVDIGKEFEMALPEADVLSAFALLPGSKVKVRPSLVIAIAVVTAGSDIV